MEYLVKNIDQYVDDDRRFENSRVKNPVVRFLMVVFPCSGRFFGNYIVILYFVVKFIYICNAILQLILIGGLLGHNFFVYGLDFFDKLRSGEGWAASNSKYFPSECLLLNILFEKKMN
jgi:hypothetical protein